MEIDIELIEWCREFDPVILDGLSKCISKITADGQDFVLIGELLDWLNVNKIKVMRYLESGKLTPYKINERGNLVKVSSWVQSMGFDRLFVAFWDFIPLIFSEHPTKGPDEKTLVELETPRQMAGPVDDNTGADAELYEIFTDAVKLWDVVLSIRKENPGIDAGTMKPRLITALPGLSETLIDRSFLNIKNLMKYATSTTGRGREHFIMAILSLYCKNNTIPLLGDKRDIYNRLTRHDTSLTCQ